MIPKVWKNIAALQDEFVDMFLFVGNVTLSGMYMSTVIMSHQFVNIEYHLCTGIAPSALELHLPTAIFGRAMLITFPTAMALATPLILALIILFLRWKRKLGAVAPATEAPTSTLNQDVDSMRPIIKLIKMTSTLLLSLIIGAIYPITIFIRSTFEDSSQSFYEMSINELRVFPWSLIHLLSFLLLAFMYSCLLPMIFIITNKHCRTSVVRYLRDMFTFFCHAH